MANQKIFKALEEFKKQILDHTTVLNAEQKEEEDEIVARKELFEFIDKYPSVWLENRNKGVVVVDASPEATMEKTKKRKRNAIELPNEIRCLAKLEDGERCNRKKGMKKDFCSFHKYEVPYGIIEKVDGIQNVVITLQKLEGIDYFVDSNDNIYSMEAIKKQTKNPPIIGKKIFAEEKQKYICQLFDLPISGPPPTSASASASASASVSDSTKEIKPAHFGEVI